MSRCRKCRGAHLNHSERKAQFKTAHEVRALRPVVSAVENARFNLFKISRARRNNREAGSNCRGGLSQIIGRGPMALFTSPKGFDVNFRPSVRSRSGWTTEELGI